MLDQEIARNDLGKLVSSATVVAGGRAEALARLLDSLIGLPDALTAGAAACALVAAELTDAGVVLTCRSAVGMRVTDAVLADYPAGIGLADISGAETLSVALPQKNDMVGKAVTVHLVAWRSSGDRRFNAQEEQLLLDIAPTLAPLVDRLIPNISQVRLSALDPETGLWTLPSFIEQADRRFDRLDIEERIGTMFAFGWVRCDGATAPEASPVVVRGSVACLQEMLRPIDLISRIGPTRLAAWCDGVDHLIAAERGDRIVTKLDSLLAGSGRHAAIGIASRWPRSGDDPALMLSRARAGLEQARLKAATQARPAVRIWQPTGP
ncbi:MAG: GGDEF domain-containing protein [Acidiphilium sp.]|nr:GGDEF domain-containing protein [Acidiphilium sp.]